MSTTVDNNLQNKVLNSKKSLGSGANSEPQTETSLKTPKKNCSLLSPSKFIYGTGLDQKEFRKFGKSMYQALQYSIKNLRNPSEDYVQSKMVRLPQPNQSKDKILCMDLDETLVHVLPDTQTKGDFSVEISGEKRFFNLRPYALEFLKKMSALYNIYVFTAATFPYAGPIIDFLNRGKKTIHGFLHRQNCMKTDHGLYIKDLRIIKNKGLSKIIIVDNLAHSFGLQIENGIPILDFKNNSKDSELKGVEKILVKASKVDDVRKYLGETLELRKVIELSQSAFLENA